MCNVTLEFISDLADLLILPVSHLNVRNVLSFVLLSRSAVALLSLHLLLELGEKIELQGLGALPHSLVHVACPLGETLGHAGLPIDLFAESLNS